MHLTKRLNKLKLLMIIGLFAFAVACGAAQETADPTAEPPTAVTEPTDVPTEEPTEEPTAAPEPTEEPLSTVGDIAMADDTFTILVDAVLATGLDTVVQGDDPITVFAPTNEAFEALPEGLLDSLTEDQIRDVLTYHVVAGEVTSSDVAGMDMGTSALGEDFTITVDGDTIMINDATIISADIQGSNGIIHVIDTVLIPPSFVEAMAEEEMMEEMGTVGDIAMGDDTFTILVDAVLATGLDTVVQGDDPITVFAPTNDAFEALPDGLLDSLTEDQIRDILTYHVVAGAVTSDQVVGMDMGTSALGEDFTVTVDGDTIMINDATIIAADIKGSNGIIHVIDTVLIPPSFVEAMAEEDEMMDEMGTVGDIAMGDDTFTILVDAVLATGLDSVVQGDDPITVFAPTNDAFEALPEGLLDSLTEDQIRDILTYHVVAGAVTSDQVVGMDMGTSALGEDFTVTVDGDTIMINDATIIAADIKGSNGIIHVIDTVLIPPSFVKAMEEEAMMDDDMMGEMSTVGDIAMADDAFTLLVDAVLATGLDTVVQGDDPITVFAPTNEAFEKLPEGLLASLTAEQLRDVLEYHVVAGKVFASDVVGMDMGTSVLGEQFTITVDGETVMINDATIITADIEGSNGVIHVIDTVLIPPSLSQ